VTHPHTHSEHHASAHPKRTRWLGAIAGAAAGLAVLGGLTLLAHSALSSEDAAATASAIEQNQHQSRRLLRLIISCTTKPSGPCAAAQRRQTAAFLRELDKERRQTIKYALACVDRPGQQTPAQIARCIRKGTR
jgi:hypothetical protein